MTIRLATADDDIRLLAFLVALAEESAFTRGESVNRSHLAARLDELLQNPTAGFIVAETSDGAIVGLLVLLLFDHLISGRRGAAQVCWYVMPEWRGSLGANVLDAGLAWACAHGATYVQMLAPEQKFAAFYTRRGYHLTDRVYERSLVCRG